MAKVTEAIRDRDELWCRCLCAALDPHDIADVLEVFNRERPDRVKDLEDS